MLGLQTHSQGSTAGLALYDPRFTSYTHHMPKFIHSKQNSNQRNELHSYSRTRSLSAWTLSPPHVANGFESVDYPGSWPPAMATFAAIPADLSRLVDIEFAAFKDEKINHHLSYRDSSDPAHIRRALRSYRKYMNSLRLAPADIVAATRRGSDTKLILTTERDMSLGFRFRKVTVPESGEIVAFCKSEMTNLSLEDLASPLDIGHECERQMNRDWFALNERLHREYCGVRKHCYFGMLATHPEYQHRGAASLLMDELVAEADQAGVEIYCEATKTGRPLYEKYGFVAVKDIVFDTALYGLGLGVEKQTVMVRSALGRDGRRRKVRSWGEAAAESAADIANMSLFEDVSGRPIPLAEE